MKKQHVWSGTRNATKHPKRERDRFGIAHPLRSSRFPVLLISVRKKYHAIQLKRTHDVKAVQFPASLPRPNASVAASIRRTSSSSSRPELCSSNSPTGGILLALPAPMVRDADEREKSCIWKEVFPSSIPRLLINFFFLTSQSRFRKHSHGPVWSLMWA